MILTRIALPQCMAHALSSTAAVRPPQVRLRKKWYKVYPMRTATIVIPDTASGRFTLGPLGFWPVLPLVRDLGVRASLEPLVRQGDQAGGLELGQDAPGPAKVEIIRHSAY